MYRNLIRHYLKTLKIMKNVIQLFEKRFDINILFQIIVIIFFVVLNFFPRYNENLNFHTRYKIRVKCLRQIKTLREKSVDKIQQILQRPHLLFFFSSRFLAYLKGFDPLLDRIKMNLNRKINKKLQ